MSVLTLADEELLRKMERTFGASFFAVPNSAEVRAAKKLLNDSRARALLGELVSERLDKEIEARTAPPPYGRRV